MDRPHRGALVALTVVGGLLVIATFLPWLRSGGTSRTSYDLLGVLDRLDVAPHGVVATLIRWWPVVPLLVTAAIVAGWSGRAYVAGALATVAALYSGGVALALVVVSHDVGIRTGGGPAICLAASIAFLAAGLAVMVTSATDRAGSTPL